MGSTNSTNLKSNHVDKQYDLTEWKTLPGVSRPLHKMCKNLPSEQNVNVYGLFPNIYKIISAVVALQAQTWSMLNFLINSVVDPITKKERPFGIGIDFPDGNHLDDESFARQRLSGANPLSIAKCENLSSLREKLENVKLSQIQIEDIMTECTSLMMNEGKSIFLMDYLFLEPYVSEPTLKEGEFEGHVPATLSIFSMDNNNQEEGLKPIRIVVIGPNNLREISRPSDRSWTFAKYCAQCSDKNVHEYKYHLTECHMMIEIIIVATNRLLKGHFVGRILLPHMRKTLKLNADGRSILLMLVGTQGIFFSSHSHYIIFFKGIRQLFYRGVNRTWHLIKNLKNLFVQVYLVRLSKW
jgi:hypothetical protein